VRRGLPGDVDAFRLAPVPYAVVGAVLAALLVWQMVRGTVGRDALSYVVTVAFFCGMILWFQHHTGRDQTLLTGGGVPVGAVTAALLGAVFVIVGAAAYLFVPVVPTDAETMSLPGVLSVIFGAVGLAWLPAVCLVLGVRAYRQTARTGRDLL